MNFDSTGYSREGPGRGGGDSRKVPLDCLIRAALWEDYLEFSSETNSSSCLWERIQKAILRVDVLPDC